MSEHSASENTAVIEKEITRAAEGAMSTFTEAIQLFTSKTDVLLPIAGVAVAGTAVSFVAEFVGVPGLSFVGNLVTAYGTWLALWAFLKVIRNQGAPDIAKQAADFGAFVQYFITSLVVGLLVLVGMIFLIIPGIYLALKYGFAPILTLDSGLGVGEAMSKSAAMTEGRKLALFGFMVISVILMIIGMIPFGLGLFVVTPIVLLAYAILYNRWKK